MEVQEFQLNDPPKDYISAVKFHKNLNQLLLVSAWDCTVRLYNTVNNSLKFTWMNEQALLDCLFLEGPVYLACGGLDGALKYYDLQKNVEETVGTHDMPINCIEYTPQANTLFSGSWDRTVKMWDLRTKGSVATFEQRNGKVYSMSVVDEKVAVATSECKALIWDLRNMKSYLILHMWKHRTRCIKISPNKECYVIGHVDGRVAVEYIKRDPEIRKCRARFKCHRMRVDNTEYVFTVNSISFQNVHNTFATGGSNGFVNIWDNTNKTRLRQYHRYDSSVTSLSFSHDGTKLAIACSDMNYNDLPILQPTITIRYISEDEVQPSQP